MIEPASGAIEFNRQGNTGCDPGSQPEEETEAEAIANAENDGISDRAGEQAQRAVLAAEQVISEIKTTEHIKAGARNADGRDGVVVHFVDCRCSGDRFGRVSVQ